MHTSSLKEFFNTTYIFTDFTNFCLCKKGWYWCAYIALWLFQFLVSSGREMNARKWTLLHWILVGLLLTRLTTSQKALTISLLVWCCLFCWELFPWLIVLTLKKIKPCWQHGNHTCGSGESSSTIPGGGCPRHCYYYTFWTSFRGSETKPAGDCCACFFCLNWSILVGL